MKKKFEPLAIVLAFFILVSYAGHFSFKVILAQGYAIPPLVLTVAALIFFLPILMDRIRRASKENEPRLLNQVLPVSIIIVLPEIYSRIGISPAAVCILVSLAVSFFVSIILFIIAIRIAVAR